MTSSVSGQDEPNPALWLATPAGKMKPSCPLGTTRLFPQEKFPRKPYNKSFVDQDCSVKMAGYWPCSIFCEVMDLESASVRKHAKKNLANIQLSWPHTWSITHTYGTRAMLWKIKIHSLWPFLWKRFVWRNPDQERTNQNARISFKTTPWHIIIIYLVILSSC